jgi:hypothetical protein
MSTLIAAKPPSTTNLAMVLKLAFDGIDMAPLREELVAHLQSNPADAAALIDLSVIEQILGDRESGLRRQAEALALQRLYRSSWPASPKALRVLAFLTPGDIGANTPVEFLLQGSDVVLDSLYVIPGRPLPDPLPDYDIAIVIAGESDEARPVLREIENLLPGWPCPVLNAPGRVPRLSREEMSGVLGTVPGLVMPPTIRIRREDFENLGSGQASHFPMIARTIGSHAGRGLAKLDDPADVAAYLADHPEAEFFISPYVDYRSPDGLFRKYRIVWVDGRPFPCHMAIADEWKVWYLNAGMADSAARRAEEAAFMTTFDEGFARRHAAALSGAAERLGLEYAGIDCAELPDGRLLVFEGDIALVAHDMDPPEIFPYKGPPMRRLFAAFYEMLKRKSVTQSPSNRKCQAA